MIDEDPPRVLILPSPVECFCKAHTGRYLFLGANRFEAFSSHLDKTTSDIL